MGEDLKTERALLGISALQSLRRVRPRLILSTCELQRRGRGQWQRVAQLAPQTKTVRRLRP